MDLCFDLDQKDSCEDALAPLFLRNLWVLFGEELRLDSQEDCFLVFGQPNLGFDLVYSSSLIMEGGKLCLLGIFWCICLDKAGNER